MESVEKLPPTEAEALLAGKRLRALRAEADSWLLAAIGFMGVGLWMLSLPELRGLGYATLAVAVACAIRYAVFVVAMNHHRTLRDRFFASQRKA